MSQKTKPDKAKHQGGGKKTTAYAARIKRKHGQMVDPRLLAGTGIAAINKNNTPLNEAEIDRLMTMTREALRLAKVGQLDYSHWVQLNSCVFIGYAIEDCRAVKGLEPMYKLGHAALLAIESRATSGGQWVAGALYGPEISALDDLVWAYEQACRLLTYGEFYKAERLAMARTRSSGQRVYTHGEAIAYPSSTAVQDAGAALAEVAAEQAAAGKP